MSRKISFYKADAAGNVTLFVTSHVPEEEYPEVAGKLLAVSELGGEQVAFVKDENTMCMCGHEFCGNASRSFALMKAKRLFSEKSGAAFAGKITVNVSGANKPLDVYVDTETNYTKIEMPGNICVGFINEGKSRIPLADMDGIVHVVLTGAEPSIDRFNELKDLIRKKAGDPPALGVMFADASAEKETSADGNITRISMTPIVYVRDVDTTYFEGSCGSGTTALCAVLSLGRKDGSYTYDVFQPKGTIRCSCKVTDGKTGPVFIEGPVDISDEYLIRL